MALSCPVAHKRTAEEAELDEPMLKKKHRRNQNYYDIFGHDASVEIEVRRDELNKRRSSFLYSRDFHALILWMLGQTISPNWIFIKHRPLIEKVIIVQIDNLNESMIRALQKQHEENQAATEFPFFQKVNYCPLQLDIPKFDKSTKHPSFKKLTVVSLDQMKGLSSTLLPSKRKTKQKHMHDSNNKNVHSKPINNNNNNDAGKPAAIASVFGDKYKHCPEMFIASPLELKRNRFPVVDDESNRYRDFFQLPPPNKPCNNKNATQFRIKEDCKSVTNASNEDGEEEEEDVDLSSNSSDASDSTVAPNDSEANPDHEKAEQRAIEKLVAMDCEMVSTKKGIELARISIVSESGECIYDELVQPSCPVIDYCTKYSGITAEILQNVTKTLSDIHTEIQSFMDASTIICGHGLENDLLALQMIHCRCIDTALLYPAPSPNYKNKLRFLAEKYLKRRIQESHDGHNSHEDALAALDLVKLKLQNGASYGLPKTSNFKSLFSVLHHFERKSSLIGPSELFEPISAATPVSTLPAKCDAETIQKSMPIIRNVENGQFLVWMYLRPNCKGDADGDGKMEALYKQLMSVYESAASNSVLITVTGNKDFRELNQFSFLLAKAIRDGQIKEAEIIAQQMRNENFNAKQYPFWISTKK